MADVLFADDVSRWFEVGGRNLMAVRAANFQIAFGQRRLSSDDTSNSSMIPGSGATFGNHALLLPNREELWFASL